MGLRFMDACTLTRRVFFPSKFPFQIFNCVLFAKLFSLGFPTSELLYQKGVRYTYRYSTTITSTLHGSTGGRNGLALDCLVDIDVVSKCHLMMQVSFNKIVFAKKQQ